MYVILHALEKLKKQTSNHRAVAMGTSIYIVEVYVCFLQVFDTALLHWGAVDNLRYMLEERLYGAAVVALKSRHLVAIGGIYSVRQE